MHRRHSQPIRLVTLAQVQPSPFSQSRAMSCVTWSIGRDKTQRPKGPHQHHNPVDAAAALDIHSPAARMALYSMSYVQKQARTFALSNAAVQQCSNAAPPPFPFPRLSPSQCPTQHLITNSHSPHDPRPLHGHHYPLPGHSVQ